MPQQESCGSSVSRPEPKAIKVCKKNWCLPRFRHGLLKMFFGIAQLPKETR